MYSMSQDPGLTNITGSMAVGICILKYGLFDTLFCLSACVCLCACFGRIGEGAGGSGRGVDSQEIRSERQI